jgi:RNA polymerase sigma-70 factor (ECF subfamily)
MGDRAAFGTIVRNHQAQALRLATAICGDSAEAYDIVQEAFVKAFVALPSIRSSDSFRPWLFRIVANQAKNARRSRWRRESRLQRHVNLRAEASTAVDDAALSTIAAHELARAVERLSRSDRDVIACRYFAELNESEAASVLGIAKGTVKSRTARALVRLRAEMHVQWSDQ